MARTPKPSGNIQSRKTNLRQQNKLVLIVCEDEKSGCDYLKLMAKHLRLHTTCIVESSATGSAPISVVEDAIKRIASRKKEKYEPFELVFCVWDIDEHTSLNDARQLAQANELNVIESNPCFEFWLLLHFVSHAAPIVHKANKSPADECVKLLKRYITDYDKSKIKDYFAELLPKTESAKINAAKLRIDLQSTGSINPVTNLDVLIKKMENNFLDEAR
jgi:hypothetical protein